MRTGGARQFSLRPLPYTVTRGWLHRVMQCSLDHPLAESNVQHDSSLFWMLIPLIQHDAFRTDSPPRADPRVAALLADAFYGCDAARFFADAGRLFGANVSMRSRPIGFQSKDPIIGRLIVGCQPDMTGLVAYALKCLGDAAAANREHPQRQVVALLIGVQILLTIHPFRDGNGRAMRAFFAARLRRDPGPCPVSLMAFLLMRQLGGARPFQQVNWAFRAGDPIPLIEMFQHSRRLAHGVLSSLETAEPREGAVLDQCWSALRRMSMSIETDQSGSATEGVPAWLQSAAGSRARR